MPKIIYCDGSCPRNGKRDATGGWNYLLVEGETLQTQTVVHSESGHELPNEELPNTSIRMELLAVIRALEYFKEPEDVIVHSDSAYVVNGINDKWYIRWFRTGKNTSGKVPANMDLWARLVDLVRFHRSVKMVHVKGHYGHRFNELADTFARQAVDRAFG